MKLIVAALAASAVAWLAALLSDAAELLAPAPGD
ncbi:MAG: hypothetical protein KatS3mg063_2387 [Tepidiforma sp.]|jgi:hypothetical protein|nr:MAG: hypothetical protein KatS3mg063_2387 [Tepidiforma sp.]